MRRISSSDSDIVISSDDRIRPSEAPDRKSGRRMLTRIRQTGTKAAMGATDGLGAAGAAMAGEPRAKVRRRMPRLRLDLTPLQKLTIAGIGALTLTVGGMGVWKSGLIQTTSSRVLEQALSATAQAGFRIQDITISGRGRTSTFDIVGALGVRHGAPILGVDIERIKDRLESLPSVRIAAVERRLPDGLHLAIVERTPVAIWQNNATHTLVDRDGHLIPGPIAGFEELPLVVGDGAPNHANELMTMLATEPKIAPRVKAAIRVGNRRWNLMLDDPTKGLEVRLPEEDPQAALHRLAEMEREKGLTARQVTMIDLRVNDRLVLKTERPATPAEPPRRKDNGA